MRPSSSLSARLPILRVANGTFYRQHPNAHSRHPNPPLFSNLSFELPSFPAEPHNWCIVGPSLSGKTTFLQLLRGRLLCEPPTARSFPYLSGREVPARLRSPHQAIRYVGFDAEQGAGGLTGGSITSAYLSARYESRRESTDFSLRDYLLGRTELNPADHAIDGNNGKALSGQLIDRVVEDLNLAHLLMLPVSFLSNGQGRRARIARALLLRPEVLLLDEPFMGLDPATVSDLSLLLASLAEKASPRLILTARPQDPLPEWITHLMYLRSDCQVGSAGPKQLVIDGLKKYIDGVEKGGLAEDQHLPIQPLRGLGRVLPRRTPSSRSEAPPLQARRQEDGQPSNAELLVQMDGCQVRYRDRTVLGNWTQQTVAGEKQGLVWDIRRGERWGVFGPNGSGKTTIVSLLASDHPQAYSLPIKLFGRSRLPEPGSGTRPLTFWDIQARVGHSSPEVHQHMPRSHSLRQVLESAWADTFRSPAKLDDMAKRKVDAALHWFAAEMRPNEGAAATSASDGLSWADDYTFSEVSFSAQRVALFLRAIIKNPDIVVLDEAFSGMDDAVRNKCTLFLAQGERKTHEASKMVESEAAMSGRIVLEGLTERQALVCIAHVKEEVPDCVREWICLPEANTGQPARFGRLTGPLAADEGRWSDVWGFQTL